MRLPRRNTAVMLAAMALAVLPACDGHQVEFASGLSATDLSGFVRLHVPKLRHSEPRDVYLTFHDPDDGAERVRLDLNVTKYDNGHVRRSLYLTFSPDFRRVAWIADHGVRVAELNDRARAYTEAGSVPPPQPSSEGHSMQYGEVQFSPDGSQIWFVLRPKAKPAWREDGATWRVLSVDATDPSGSPPRQRGHLPAPAQSVSDLGQTLLADTNESAFQISSDNTLRVLERRSDRDDRRNLDYFSDGSQVIPANFRHYTGRSYLRLSDTKNRPASERDGLALVAFDMNPDGTVSNERTLFRYRRTSIWNVYVDAANDRLILWTDDGFYSAAIDSDADPQRLFDTFTHAEPAPKFHADIMLGFYPQESE